MRAKQIFRRCSELRPTAREEGKQQSAMNDRLFQSKLVEILAQPSINWNPPHCALMPLNHPLLTRGPCQAGTVAGTAFVGMVMGHCWRKRPSADPGLKRAAAHRAPGTHYPV